MLCGTQVFSKIPDQVYSFVKNGVCYFGCFNLWSNRIFISLSLIREWCKLKYSLSFQLHQYLKHIPNKEEKHDLAILPDVCHPSHTCFKAYHYFINHLSKWYCYICIITLEKVLLFCNVSVCTAAG